MKNAALKRKRGKCYQRHFKNSLTNQIASPFSQPVDNGDLYDSISTGNYPSGLKVEEKKVVSRPRGVGGGEGRGKKWGGSRGAQETLRRRRTVRQGDKWR